MGLNEFVQIGNRLRKLRTEKALTQKEMAQLAGIPYTTYSNYENNNRTPSTSNLKNIANALGMEVNDILSVSFIDNWDELPEKYEQITGRKLKPKNTKTDDYFEVFLCYLESLGYSLSVCDHSEMLRLNITPESEDDFYIGIQDNKHDNVTFFHKKDFLNFQNEIEKNIDYEIYKQFRK